MKRPDMNRILKTGRKGNVVIDRITVNPSVALLDNLRFVRDGRPWMVVQPGKYTRLITKRGLEMSNTDMEWRTNQRIINEGHGHVLIGGLGIGFIVTALCRKAEVKSVTVVEVDQDVIDLVGPQIAHKKLTIVQGDIVTHHEQLAGRQFDVIYLDIWQEIDTDNIPQMNALRRSYRKLLSRTNDKAFIDCWTYDILRKMRREENSERYFGW